MKLDSSEDLMIATTIAELGIDLGDVTIPLLDFETLASTGVDAIWLTEEGVRSTSYAVTGKRSGLWGWDVPTALWLRFPQAVFTEGPSADFD